ncbi:MAG: hypothetical protein R3A46_13210 [Thermomicrobiales bacterium]
MFERASNFSHRACLLAGVGCAFALLVLAGCVGGDAGSDADPDRQPLPTVVESTASVSTATFASVDPSSTPFIRPTSVISPTVYPVPEPVNLVVDRAIDDYGVIRAAVELFSYEPATWSSTALGCPERGRSYAQIVTSGYEVVLSVLGAQVVYHVDDTGAAIVECEGAR